MSLSSGDLHPERSATRGDPESALPSVWMRLLLQERTRVEWGVLASFLVYAAACVLLYFALVQPWIDGRILTRVGADSDRYWDSAKELRTSMGAVPLISLTGNFLGPVLFAYLLQSGFLVMCLNFSIFVVSMRLAGTFALVNKPLFWTLMLLNAELIPSLTTLNKEIFALLAAILTAKYVESTSRPKLLLLGTLMISLLARWEMSAILMLYLALTHRPFRGRAKLALAFLIVAITLLYPISFKLLGVDPSLFDYLLEGANTIVKLNSIQDAYGFPLVLIPKILMTMAGRLAQPVFYTDNELFHGGTLDLQQEVFQPLGCLAFLVVFGWALFTGRLNFRRPLAFLIWITLIVTAITPFVQSRYLYGAYVLLALELSRPKGTVATTRKRTPRALETGPVH